MNHPKDNESGEKSEELNNSIPTSDSLPNTANEDESVMTHPSFAINPIDNTFNEQVQRLHRFTVYGRWFVVGILWVSVGSLSLWKLRYPISLWLENFTWSAVRYGLFYNPLPTLGLSFCIGMTVAVLVWQSRNILLGISASDRQRLERQVNRIRQQGSTHPLWKWVCH